MNRMLTKNKQKFRFTTTILKISLKMAREKSTGVLVIRGPSLILKKSQFLNC